MNTMRRLRTTFARAFPCRWCKKKPDQPDNGGNIMEGNKALLVGINEYPSAPLEGCVNDVNAIAELLVSQYKFKEENIRLLVDNRATTSAIIERLNWLIQANPGEMILFHYSGHGVQIPTRNHAGEIDNLLEAISPYDFDWSESRMITDKQFVEIFKKIPSGVIFNWLSDSCHSGDLDRNMPLPKTKPRRYPIPADIAWRQRIAAHKIIQRARVMINGVLDVGFMSGCQSNQTSADAYIDGKPCGAFTYFFLKAIKESPTLPLEDLGKKVIGMLAANGYAQCPSTEGARKSLPFLGSQSTPGSA